MCRQQSISQVVSVSSDQRETIHHSSRAKRVFGFTNVPSCSSQDMRVYSLPVVYVVRMGSSNLL